MNRVYLWGKGKIYNVFKAYAHLQKDILIAGIIQTNSGEGTLTPEELLEDDTNWCIIITNASYRACLETCKKIGIAKEKVIIPYLTRDNTNKYDCIKKMHAYVKNPEAVINALTWYRSYSNDMIGPMTYDTIEYSLFTDIKTWEDEQFEVMPQDYSRIRTLELLIQEIRRKNLQGSMAEVGVFTGSFAKIMSFYLKEKKLFLYDTFEGFKEEDYVNELKKQNFTEEFMSIFQNTNVDKVKKYIGNTEKCHYRVGYFPNTIEEMEKDEKFCLVSLDADMYNPTLAGLEFFYPRLEKGGYILIHEYNCRAMDYIHQTLDIQNFEGIKKAVYDFEKKYGDICLVPITDRNGTIVITK